MFRFLFGPEQKPAKSKSRSRASSRDAEVIEFRGHRIQLRRQSYRRTLSLSVREDGTIRLLANQKTPTKALTGFLAENLEWLETNVKKHKLENLKNPPKRFTDGELFYYLGRPRRLRFQAADRQRPKLVVGETEIICHARPGTEPELIAKAFRAYYRNEARQLLTDRMTELSARLKMYPRTLSFRSQKTRWGSCSSSGEISLNWRLLIAPLDVIDYVLIHELCHLKHPNHGPAFWNLVEKATGDTRPFRKWLRAHQKESDFLSK